MRARQWLRYGTAAGSLYAFEIHPESGLRVPAPGVSEGREVRIEVNSRGFRSPELADPKPPGTVRLAFLGGSTTFCAEASDNESAWPHLVWAALAQRFPGASLDYLNAAAGGLAANHSLTNWRHRVAPTEPDVVVIYHATNDLALGSRELAREAGLVDAQADESWLARVSLAWNLIEKNLRARFASGGADRGPLDPDPAPHAERFRRVLTELVDACAESGTLVVLVTFAHKARRDQEPEVQRANCASSFFYMPYMSVEGVLAGIEAYNDVIRDVARASDSLLVEGAVTIPGDAQHFADSVHFLDAGCALQARRVVDALEAWPAFLARVDD